MQSLLLIISFLIHIVALYAIYRLSQQLQSFKKADTAEITELFELYLQEIKEENNRLQDKISSKTPPHIKPEKTQVVSNNLKNDNHQKEINVEPTAKYAAPFIDAKVDDLIETSLEARILQLHHQGMSITEIAQKLDRGKTEVELFIKLHQK
ncbi:DUF6115 domain-containing protein [Oceanobacillus chungangensis]|uniref:Swarming motility protein SwrB n=1 Tax=Oceanobacillus chungangensis TaxID=1229152 RepID=A0A3D8PQ31_9BACI|nr:hypothetical protein [Oceanobacillus chungangensis]RDW17812.1 hypothetical protein CWR45_10790 [Oceanobacillus chungangensis]